MLPFAKKVSVTFKSSLKDFPKKGIWTGNAIRKELFTSSKEKGLKEFYLNKKLPVILIVGGGTGAKRINELIAENLENLLGITQVIHITGKDRGVTIEQTALSKQNYRSYEFLTKEMKHAYACSDLVVSRAGASSLSEIAALEKPSIIVPIPNSHQELNSALLKKQKAAIVLEQNKISSRDLIIEIKRLLNRYFIANRIKE